MCKFVPNYLSIAFSLTQLLKKGKLIPWFTGQFQIIAKVRLVSYRVALPLGMTHEHPLELASDLTMQLQPIKLPS